MPLLIERRILTGHRLILAMLAMFGCALSPAAPASGADSTAAPGDAQWAADLHAYDIIWKSQSSDAVNSMPLSGGVLGLNVWVEHNDILFLIASPNCMNEQGMQTKLGRVRLHFAPSGFATDFRQELDLAKSEIIVSGKTIDGQPITVRLWCDVFHPAIHVSIASGAPVEAVASYETWSNFDAKFVDGGFQWVRRLDPAQDRRSRDMKAQGMTEFASAIPDPLTNLTEGGQLVAAGMEPDGMGEGKFNGMNLKTCSVKTTQPVTKLDLSFALRMEQDKSLEDWRTAIDSSARQAAADGASARTASLAWWKEFWSRSYIDIRPGADATDKPWQAGRNYQLVRYQSAANRGGRAMTLFNGGMFTCTGNPDGRNWDGCQFMAQNQRLVYWPMLRAGDDDLLRVALDFYRDRTEMSRLHAKKFWGVDGVAWSEPFSIFGLDSIGTNADGRSSPDHLHYHYTSGMEFALMMLELGRYTGQDITAYLPAPEGIIAYYDQFYRKHNKEKTGQELDAAGHLVIYPSDACEPFHGCKNNTDVIAGLTALCDGLLALPPKYLTPAERAYYGEFKKRIPPFPIKETGGHRYFAPAESWEWVFYNGNMDFPNMYVCFPFNIVALGRPGIEAAEATWDYGAIRPAVQRQNQCWYQSAINLARLGRTTEAAQATLGKLLNPGARFPTFYHTHYAGGSGEFCQLPDTDHGGVAMTALQEMLMQTDGKRILLGPAWPAGWDCSFKLHAPYETTVTGRVDHGRVIVDNVTPAARSSDIEIFPLKEAAPDPLSEGKPATASSEWGSGYEAGKAVDGDLSTRWAMAAGHKAGWLEVDLGQPAEVSRAVIQEISYPRVSKFSIDALMDDGQWRSVATGDTIGANKEIKFTPIKAQKFRLNILDASDAPTIEEFQLFAK